MSSKKYFKEIFEKNLTQDPVVDAIRALSVLSIIAFHVTLGILQIYGAEQGKNYILNMPAILQPLWHSEKGVDAFFLISALVLGIPIFRKIEAFDVAAAVAFYKKRLFRIYPLFLFALVLYTIARWSYFGKYFFSNALLINNLIAGERTIIPVGWSLLVEVQYYFFLPAVFFFLKKTRNIATWLIAFFLLSIVSCAAILIVNPDLYSRPLTDLFLAPDRGAFGSRMGDLFYESDLSRFGPFVAGLLLAYWQTRYSERIKKIFQNKTTSYAVFLISSGLFMAVFALPLYNPNSWYYSGFTPERNFLMLVSIRQAFAVALTLFMLGCWHGKGPFLAIKNFFSLRIWTPISRLSFPIYLFHFPFIAVAAVLVFGTTDVKMVTHVSFLQGLAVFLVAVATTIGFSIPLYVYIERPFIEKAKTPR